MGVEAAVVRLERIAKEILLLNRPPLILGTFMSPLELAVSYECVAH
jgi:hypothetical protein